MVAQIGIKILLPILSGREGGWVHLQGVHNPFNLRIKLNSLYTFRIYCKEKQLQIIFSPRFCGTQEIITIRCCSGKLFIKTFYVNSVIKFYYPVDIFTTVFSYSCDVQYHTILHGVGVIARALGLCGILATTMCFN